MALKRKIAGGREGAVAAAEHRNLSKRLSLYGLRSVEAGFSMKCWTLPNAVRGRSPTNMISRGT